MAKDIVRQELNIGDVIVFNPPYQKGLVVGTIIKMTEKTVTAKWETHSYNGTAHFAESNRSLADVCRVDPQYAVLYHLSRC